MIVRSSERGNVKEDQNEGAQRFCAKAEETSNERFNSVVDEVRRDPSVDTNGMGQMRLLLPSGALDRDNNFDGIRLILAGMVIYTHSCNLTGNSAREAISVITQGQASAGGVGVTLFFALSGYLVAQSLERSASTLDFFWKRIIRVYPAFLVAVFASWLIAGPLGGASFTQLMVGMPSALKVLLGGGAPYLIGFCDGSPEPWNLNGSLWTIRFEVASYVCLLLLSLVGLSKYRYGWLMALILAYTLNIANGRTGLLPDLVGGFLNLFVPFLAGTTAFFFRDAVLQFRWVGLLSLILIVASSGFGGFWLITPLCGAVVIVRAGLSPLLPLRFIRRIGDFSYGLYVYSFPVQQLLAQFLGPDASVILHCFSSLLMTFALALPSWYLLEKPMLRFKNMWARPFHLRVCGLR